MVQKVGEGENIGEYEMRAKVKMSASTKCEGRKKCRREVRNIIRKVGEGKMSARRYIS